jgi:hypothetical protein
MILETGTRAAVPLPEFSQQLPLAGSTDEIGFRRFGISGKISMSISRHPNRAALGTRLLEQCTCRSSRFAAG